ncbi:glycoside hydrolase family 18 protein [Atractiella rhizophila]|nr:glycoside hydrolase family 18 protein [Atractiella rhizophila]
MAALLALLTFAGSLFHGVFSMPITNQTVSTLAQNPPHFVLYSDKWANQGAPPAASALDGWNVFVLSFWLATQGPFDMVQGWVWLTDQQRADFRAQYDAVGAKIMVAAFGATDRPTSAGLDPVTTATNLANFAKQYNVHGVDIDYEDFDAMNGGTAEAWLITFTRELRNQLGSDYIITHAPVAPWFTDNTDPSGGKFVYPGGGYTRIHQEVGDLIDWYNIQFYNQGTDYTTCDSLLHTSAAIEPHTSIFEMAARGIDLNKLVLGKPASTGSASSGYVSPDVLSGCVAEAKASGYSAGLMVWQYPDQPVGYVNTVWG